MNEELTTHVVTILLHTELDAETILELAQQLGCQLADEAESYGEEVVFNEEEVSVEYGTEILGGE